MTVRQIMVVLVCLSLAAPAHAFKSYKCKVVEGAYVQWEKRGKGAETKNHKHQHRLTFVMWVLSDGTREIFENPGSGQRPYSLKCLSTPLTAICLNAYSKERRVWQFDDTDTRFTITDASSILSDVYVAPAKGKGYYASPAFNVKYGSCRFVPQSTR